MTELDLRTPFEIAQEEKHRYVCNRYKELREEYPEVAPYRIIWLIAKDENVNMTVPGVRSILDRNGLYKGKEI